MFAYIIYSKNKKFIFDILFNEEECIKEFNEYYDSNACDWSAISFEKILEVI